MNTVKILKFKGFTFVRSPMLTAICYGKSFWVLGWPKRVIRLASYLRSLFPRFYAIGLHDCDSGGHVYQWFVTMVPTRFQIERMSREWHESGDGPATVRQISFIDFIQARRREREERELRHE